MNNALENYYLGLNNVVLRDNTGYPSIFVKHLRQNSNEFYDELPDATHPAFTCGLDENNEPIIDDGVLISKYLLSSVKEGGALYSLPNAKPAIPPTVGNWNTVMDKIKSGVSGVTPMTIADYGLLSLIILKNNLVLRGNNYHGVDYTRLEAGKTIYASGKQYNVGDICYFRGQEVKCLKQHTSNTTTSPNYPGSIGGAGLWKFLPNRICTINPDNTSTNINGLQHLTGSGPIEWYVDGNIEYEADLSLATIISDYRLYNGRIQIIPYNKAADPNTNIHYDSNEWCYIAIDDHDELGYHFVSTDSPSDEDHLLRWIWDTDHSVLSAKSFTEFAMQSSGWRSCAFTSLTVDENTVGAGTPIVKLFKELGLLPITGANYPDAGYMQWYSSTNQYYCTVGTNCQDQVNRFVGRMVNAQNMTSNEGFNTYPYVTFRARARIIAES